ncbi:hypothetical protein H6G57_22300 [Planktothrix sp. FACHB-1365]|nr:hypothetical protein [Planktothrix sp. FACHB-1365]
MPFLSVKEMKLKQSFQRLALFILSALLVVTLTPFISYAQSATPSPATGNVPFYNTSDFWSKVALAIISTLLGALSGYWSSEKKRKDEAIELSYTQDKFSVLEFKKDIGKTLSIRYGNYEVADLYVMSCNIRNTCKKVIKNEPITFEIQPANVGILDQFFEPSLENNNSMGIEELQIDNLKVGEANSCLYFLILEHLQNEFLSFYRWMPLKSESQQSKYNINIGTGTDIFIGDKYSEPQESKEH